MYKSEQTQTYWVALTSRELSNQDTYNWCLDETCGAVVVFSGTTRNHCDEHIVINLDFEAYDVMAISQMKNICQKAINQFKGLKKTVLHHRIGIVKPCESSVICVVSAEHRKEAYEASQWMMCELKAMIPIWKKENYLSGNNTWKENTEQYLLKENQNQIKKFNTMLLRRWFSILSHVDINGKVQMVDICNKRHAKRVAIAQGSIYVGKEVFDCIVDNEIKKGDVLSIAKIAGIMSAKKCHEIIPLCHPINIKYVDIKLEMIKPDSINIMAIAKVDEATGVEMEALTAVSVTALTIYDMCKAVSKEMVIKDIQLLFKEGGKSGIYEKQ